MNKLKRLNYGKSLLFLAIVSCSLFFLLNRDIFLSLMKGDLEEIQPLLSENLVFVCLLTLVIMIIQNSFTVIPLILVITVNITLFGFLVGFLWSWITSVIAAIVVFLFVRNIFQDHLIKKIKQDHILKIEENGFSYVFQGRVFPFIPTSFINLLAGLSSIRLKHFILGTLLGNFLYFFILSLIPAGLMSLNISNYVIGLIILIIFSIYYGYKYTNRRMKKEKS
jgi:uncharacterized membrane protein YdjX (TVP38/TMEM64 family)